VSRLQRTFLSLLFQGRCPGFTLRAFSVSARAADETVADAHYSFNAITTFTKLLSESPDVNVERARIAVIAVAPDAVEQLLTGDNPISALCQD
jgi:hypothetical protein